MKRTALVTGASRGLGAAMARALAEAGLSVAVNYLASRERAEALCAELRGRGHSALAFRADVRAEADVVRLVAEVERDLGPIDVLVVNATGHQPMLAIEEQSWQSYLDQLEFFVKSAVVAAAGGIAGDAGAAVWPGHPDRQ